MLRRHFFGALFPPTPSSLIPVRFGVIGTGGRGTALMDVALNIPGVSVTALCDIDPNRTARARDRIRTRGLPSPAVFADHRRLLDHPDLDAVLVATPEQAHAAHAVDALSKGKAVLSEVAAAVTLDECWRLVETAERTRGFYMLSENCCYYRSNLAVRAMADQGIFGEITSAECAYLHSIPNSGFRPDGLLTWRGELMRDQANWYPTHAIGPVAQWLRIGKQERFARLTAYAAPPTRIREFTQTRYGPSSQAAKANYTGDGILAIIETTAGRLIEIRLDTISARPTVSTTHYTLQGTRGIYQDAEGQRRIWLEGAHKENAWGDWAPYETRYDDSAWTREEQQARQSGHGGADWFTLRAFFQAVANRQPSPINVYDAVDWSSIIALSTQSIQSKGKTMDFPNFRRNE